MVLERAFFREKYSVFPSYKNQKYVEKRLFKKNSNFQMKKICFVFCLLVIKVNKNAKKAKMSNLQISENSHSWPRFSNGK
jgi:hypothetical protein